MDSGIACVEVKRKDDPRLPTRVKPGIKRVCKPVRDCSQRWRRGFQIVFLLLNLAIGFQFYLFIRYFESAGGSQPIPRPPGVDGWLPIGGMMNLKYALGTGNIPAIHPAAMVLLVAFLLMSLFFRKAFCGWLCPIGTLSEGLWKLGRKYFNYNWSLPNWADLPLRSLKYILFGLFLYAVASMPVASLQGFLESPYFKVADVKMLNFFRYMGSTAAITLVVLAGLSVLVKNFWCRYLCPYGALMGLASLISPSGIRRDPQVCIDCARCARSCPALLPVDRLLAVRSPECMACMECVAVCPARGALQMSLPGLRPLPPWMFAAGIAAVFLGIVLIAGFAGVWQTRIPDEVYFQLIPRVQEFIHP